MTHYEPWLFYEQELRDLAEIMRKTEVWSYVQPTDKWYPSESKAIGFLHWYDAEAMLAVLYGSSAEYVVYLSYQDPGFLGEGPLFRQSWQVMSCRVDDVYTERLGNGWGQWLRYAILPDSWIALKQVRVYLGCAVRKRTQGVSVESVRRRGYSSEFV